MLPNVFELFVQGHRTIDRSQGGLGIGLTLVKSLIELHGGTIEAKSDGVGKGTEFVVRLPAMARGSHEPTLARSHKLGVATISGVRVLLVDDNVDAAEILAESLRSLGHEVTIAHDGPEALRLVTQLAPDTAILDIGLPVMDGYELATKIREQMAARPPRLIALTGYGQEADKARSSEAGFDVHLVKPVNLSTIVAFLNDRPSPSSTGTRIRAVRPSAKQMP
jgi:CheY-like chemotaxis protein